MSYMRYPLYAWVSGACEDDCPDDCDRRDHMRVNLWVKDGDDRVSVIDPDMYDDSIVGGIGIRMDLFDEIVALHLAR